MPGSTYGVQCCCSVSTHRFTVVPTRQAASFLGCHDVPCTISGACMHRCLMLHGMLHQGEEAVVLVSACGARHV